MIMTQIFEKKCAVTQDGFEGQTALTTANMDLLTHGRIENIPEIGFTTALSIHKFFMIICGQRHLVTNQ